MSLDDRGGERLVKHAQESTSAMLGELARLGSATVYEAAGRGGYVDADLVQVVPDSRAAGPARTVRCGQGDNLMVHAVMAALRPGDVLVLTMPQPAPVALVGELLATQAKVRGAAAVVVDASIRDFEELSRMGLPIWARWVRVKGATKSVVGEIDVPVSIGGATIQPGDVLVLDRDGVAVIDQTKAGDVLEAALEREERESAKRARLEAGELSWEIDGLREHAEQSASS